MLEQELLPALSQDGAVPERICEAQVQVSTTRLFLSSMTNVLRETSQDREYLNRLRSFGLPDLSDAYLVSIDTSDGQHVRHIHLTCTPTDLPPMVLPVTFEDEYAKQMCRLCMTRPGQRLSC